MSDTAPVETGLSGRKRPETHEDKLEDRKKPGSTGAGGYAGNASEREPDGTRSGTDYLGSRNLDNKTEDRRPRNFCD